MTQHFFGEASDLHQRIGWTQQTSEAERPASLISRDIFRNLLGWGVVPKRESQNFDLARGLECVQESCINGFIYKPFVSMTKSQGNDLEITPESPLCF